MRVNIGDVRLFFDVEGAKLRPDGAMMREVPTVILLHGGPGFDHSNFKPDFSRLAEVAQVVYLDHRGNGRSDRGDPKKWNLPQWGDDLRAFCDALEIERPVVLGNSFGGMVAMSYATRHPDHPAKLVLSSTAAVSRRDRSLEMFQKRGGAEAREAAQRFFDNPGAETADDFQKKCLPLYNRVPSGPEFTKRSVMNLELMVDYFKHESHTVQLSARPWTNKMSDADYSGRPRSDSAGRRFAGYRSRNGARGGAPGSVRERGSRSLSRRAGSLLQNVQRISSGVMLTRWRRATSLRDFSNSSKS